MFAFLIKKPTIGGDRWLMSEEHSCFNHFGTVEARAAQNANRVAIFQQATCTKCGKIYERTAYHTSRYLELNGGQIDSWEWTQK